MLHLPTRLCVGGQPGAPEGLCTDGAARHRSALLDLDEDVTLLPTAVTADLFGSLGDSVWADRNSAAASGNRE